MKNNKYELEVQNKAVKAGALSMLLLATTFFILEIVFLDSQNYGWYAIISLYCAVVYTFKAIKLPSKNSWFLGALWFLVTIVCVINYVIHRFYF